MTDRTRVWDASALHHVARADRVDVVADLARDCRNVTTRVVVDELQRYGLAEAALAPGWLEEVRLDDLAELTAYVEWSSRVGTSGGANAGEATVLAWTEVHGAVAILDDKQARRVGTKHGVTVHGTLWVLAGAVAGGRAAEAGVAGLVRALDAAGARFPVGAVTDFGGWARSQGLLQPGLARGTHAGRLRRVRRGSSGSGASSGPTARECSAGS